MRNPEEIFVALDAHVRKKLTGTPMAQLPNDDDCMAAIEKVEARTEAWQHEQKLIAESLAGLMLSERC